MILQDRYCCVWHLQQILLEHIAAAQRCTALFLVCGLAWRERTSPANIAQESERLIAELFDMWLSGLRASDIGLPLGEPWALEQWGWLISLL